VGGVSVGGYNIKMFVYAPRPIPEGQAQIVSATTKDVTLSSSVDGGVLMTVVLTNFPITYDKDLIEVQAFLKSNCARHCIRHSNEIDGVCRSNSARSLHLWRNC